MQYWKIPACFTDGLSVLPVLSLFISHFLHFRVQIGFSSRFLVFFRQAFLRQLFDVHIPALCCRAKHGHGSSLSGCEGVSVPPGASDGTNFPRIFASIVGWCSIPRLSAGTGTSIALILFFGPVDRFCLGRDSTRSCLCAQFWPFVIVRTGIRAQVGNFFCLYVDYGGFSFSQNKILCAGAPGVNRPSPRLAPPRVRMLAKKKKKRKGGKRGRKKEF